MLFNLSHDLSMAQCILSAHEHSVTVKNNLSRARTIAVDVPNAVFEDMTKNMDWLKDDDALRTVAAGLPAQYGNYAYQIKEAVNKQKTDGRFVLLYGIRQERTALLTVP